MVDKAVMKSRIPKEEGRKSAVPEQEGKFARVKRILTGSLSCRTRTPITYDEAKISCKARKRKERQESISSLSQERKVIRSNSEERPLDSKTDLKNDIRRVLSHEDFQKSHPLHEHNNSHTIIDLKAPKSPHRDSQTENFGYDDCEHERLRSHERFSKPLAPRGRRTTHGRRRRVKHFSKSCKDESDSSKENGNCNGSVKSFETVEDKKTDEDDGKSDLSSFLKLHHEEKERSPSPVHSLMSPALDLTTLHQQIDCCEPIPSSSLQISEDPDTLPTLSIPSNRMLSSPRNSIMMTRRIYLDPNIPQNNSSFDEDTAGPYEKRLRQLSKQINSIKKKIKKYDEEFEMKYGYRPSHADTLNDKNVRRLYSDLNKLKKEYKQMKEDSSNTVVKTVSNDASKATEDGDRGPHLKDTLNDIEKRLTEKRSTAERNVLIESMNNDQIMDEKVAVQKALLFLESMHGRPSSKEDRDLVRPLYDRYRTLKRMVTRITMSTSATNELATIHEHETMDFVSTPVQNAETETESEKLITIPGTDSDTDTSSVGENLHTLTLEELIQLQKITGEEKKRLRRVLKEYENDFQTKTGRKLQKDDKTPMENVYSSYKQAKAKLRLLDALVGKQML